MHRNHLVIVPVALLSIVFVSGCGKQAMTSQTVDAERLQMFKPLPEALRVKAGGAEEQRVQLGRMLYYDARLSRSQKISCNTCHKLDAYGVDNEPTSEGYRDQRGERNSPTVYNAAAHFVQFWDGRAKDVEAQAKGPVLNPVEMAMASDKQVVAVLKSMPEYVDCVQAGLPRRQRSGDLRQRGERHRHVRAQAADARALGQVPEGRRHGAHPGRESRLQCVL
jgi:cytochrome c peroxidase